jgi:hypothetical protein
MSILEKIKNADWSYTPHSAANNDLDIALTKTINSVPEMLSILERLASIKIPSDTFIQEVDAVAGEAIKLLNKLNSEI